MTYTTVQGDMWDGVAYKALGSTAYTDKLVLLNLRYIDVYVFPAGVELILPVISPPSPPGAPPWRGVPG